MEGYLTLVTKGFTGTKLRKVWVVLDRQQMTWYDHLDLTDQMPKKLKGALFIKDAILKKVVDASVENCLLIECRDSKTLFSCGDANICSSWYKALTRAVSWHKEQAKKESLPKQYCKQLGLSDDEILNKVTIARAYKRLCLKEHPDKGGNVEVFNKIKEAYNYMVGIQTIKDEIESTVPIQFEAILQKQEGKTGLGLSVTYDSVNERLLVGKMHENAVIKSITEEAGGEIKPGDRIVGIDHDDCSHWPMSRFTPRLSLVRVPIGGTVVLTFERRVSADEIDQDDEDELYGYSPEPSPMPSTIIPMGGSKVNSPVRNTNIAATPATQEHTAKSDSKTSMKPINSEPTTNVDTALPQATAEPSHHESEAESLREKVAVPVPVAEDASGVSGASVASSLHVSTADSDSETTNAASSLQARAAARERLRLRAMEAVADEEQVAPVLIAPVVLAPTEEPNTPIIEPTVTRVVPEVIQKYNNDYPPSGVVVVKPTPQPAVRESYSNPPDALATKIASEANPAAPSLQPPPFMLQNAIGSSPYQSHTASFSPPSGTRINTTNSKPAVETLPAIFAEALHKQQESFVVRLRQLENELCESQRTVRKQAAELQSQHAENATLKDTVASMARLIERQGSENPDSRTELVVQLQRSVSDLQGQVMAQERLLAQYLHQPIAGGQKAPLELESATSVQHNREYQLQCAHRLEKLVTSAAMQKLVQR